MDKVSLRYRLLPRCRHLRDLRWAFIAPEVGGAYSNAISRRLVFRTTTWLREEAGMTPAVMPQVEPTGEILLADRPNNQ